MAEEDKEMAKETEMKECRKDLPPRISIVLPTYNGAGMVGKSIESVIGQSYRNWELIIVNDCSTDNTLEVVNKYAESDNRVRVFTNEVNKKLPASLNVGFSKAEGELFTWTSDDNAFHSNALEVMSDTLDRNPDIDLVYADYDIVDQEGDFVGHGEVKEPDHLKYDNRLGACFLYRRSLAEKIGEYDTSLFLAEDYEYWIRAYLNGKLQHIKETLYDYGVHEKSLTSTRIRDAARATIIAKEKHRKELLKKCSSREEKMEFYRCMLKYTGDKKEYEDLRRKYHRLDLGYAVLDNWSEFRGRLNEKLAPLKRAVKRVIRKS